MGVIDIFFAGENAGKLKKINKQADAVMALDETFAALSDQELVAKTQAFKQRYADERNAGCAFTRSVCTNAGSRMARARHETLSGSGYRRYRFAPGTYCRDENR